uniref:glutathione transferase n=1 Tax=Paramormyrops kingsleyae TaxID=1676925 RepID=A0A3B3R9M5_9TELE
MHRINRPKTNGSHSLHRVYHNHSLKASKPRAGLNHSRNAKLESRYTENQAEVSDSISGKLFVQLPKFEDGSLVLFQSNAILRYFGCIHGTYCELASLIDMMNDRKWQRCYIKELPDQIKDFEKMRDKVTYYNLFDFLLNQKVLSPPCLDSFSALKSYVDKIAVRPKIKAFMESDSYKKLPINGNGKQ